jgi:hypothetical protein
MGSTYMGFMGITNTGFTGDELSNIPSGMNAEDFSADNISYLLNYFADN